MIASLHPFPRVLDYESGPGFLNFSVASFRWSNISYLAPVPSTGRVRVGLSSSQGPSSLDLLTGRLQQYSFRQLLVCFSSSLDMFWLEFRGSLVLMISFFLVCFSSRCRLMSVVFTVVEMKIWITSIQYFNNNILNVQIKK